MKKLGLIIAALALVLGLTQCRKPDTSMWISGCSKQTITFSNSGDDGQKGLFHDAEGVLKYEWKTGDVIHVYATTNPYSEGNTDFGSNSMYCGKLDKVTITSETTATFTGEINVPNKAKALRFVHYGKGVTVEKGVATVDFASQTGVIKDVSDKVIAKCDRPYTGDVYENCKLAVAFAILKFSFEKFTSDIVTLKTPVNTQISVAAGGAISYDTQDEIDFNIASLSDKGDNRKEYFAVLMPKEETIYVFSDGLKRASGSIEVKENGYYTTTGTGVPVIVNTEPDINPSDMKYTSILTNNITLGVCSSDGFTFSCTSRSGWERIFVPIYNLEPGQWYTITFGETVTRSSTGAWWCGQGTYSANVTDGMNTGGVESNIPYSIRQSPEKFACVMCLGGYNDGHNDNFPYTQTPKVSTTFKATAETMYWTVEFAQFADDVEYTFNINLVDYGIKKIEPEHTYYADMPNSTMHGYTGVENADKGLCSFKVYADYHTIDFYSYGANAHEKFNVPLKGLTVGKNYRLTFDYTRTRFTGISEFEGYPPELDNCFGISADENTNTSSSGLHNTSGYGDNFEDSQLSKYTIEFTATKTTMYWVWSQSDLRDGARFHQVAKNITLEQIN